MIPLKLSSHVLPHCIRLCFKEERESRNPNATSVILFTLNKFSLPQRVDRVLQSSELWDPHPRTRRRVFTPALVPGGRHTLFRERGGGPNSDERSDTVVL